MINDPNRILVITRDLSYTGGTEYFLHDYLQYLASQTNPANIYLLEVEGSGKFANRHLEIDLRKAGINVLTVPDNIAELEFWDPHKLSYFDDLVTQTEPRIIHTFLFNADFVAFYLKVGESVCSDLISKTRNINQLRSFYKKAFLELPKIKKRQFKWISSKLNNFSVALEMNTEEWKIRKDFIDSELEPIISHFSDQITVVSDEGLKKWGKLSVHPLAQVPCSAIGKNDLDIIDEINSNRHDNAFDKTTKFICVSRLVAGKGIEDLVTAFRKALLRNNEITLTIVGDGNLLESIKTSIRDIPQIKVTGFVPREEVFKMLAVSDVFVLASYSEGLPLSIQEAMAFRLPVVATNVGGNPDLVSDHKNGILFNPGDVDALSSSILELSQSSSLRQQMGLTSRQILEGCFLKEKSYDALMGLYY